MATTNLKKNSQGYGYMFTGLPEINNYLESINVTYYQETRTEDGEDYIYTIPTIDGVVQPARRGCRIVQAILSGKSNPAQEQGSALTYARRYSLLMAFGLATTDDDAQLCQSDEVVLSAYNDIKKHKAEYQKGVIEHYGLNKLEDMTREQAEDYIKQMQAKKG